MTLQYISELETRTPPPVRLPDRSVRTPLRTFKVDPTTDLGWALFPVVVRRIGAFCERHPTDLVALDQQRLLWTLWWQQPQEVCLIAVVTPTMAAVGHCFAVHDTSRHVAFVYQLEVDLPMLSAEWQSGYDLLESWARQVGAKAVELSTHHPPRLFTRHGFTPYRTIMRREVT